MVKPPIPFSQRAGFNQRDFAAVSGFTVSKVREMRDQGLIKTVKVLGAEVYPASELDRMLNIVDLVDAGPTGELRHPDELLD